LRILRLTPGTSRASRRTSLLWSRIPWSSESSLYLLELRPGPCVPFG
jgi:hypothetical protein